jgi:putative ABC transport system permease protein
MFLRILKKDLKRKRTMNIVIFLFIIIATAFLASSVTNLFIVSDGVNEFFRLTHIPDFLVMEFENDVSDNTLSDWVQRSDYVNDYVELDSLVISKNNIKLTHKDYDISNTMVLQSQPQYYMQLYNEDNEFLELQKGEIAIPMNESTRLDIKIGDIITLKYEEVTKELSVKYFVKDSLCGSNMMGLKRLIISHEDYGEFSNQDNLDRIRFHCIKSDELDLFIKDYKLENFTVLTSMDKSMIATQYIIDKLIYSILIIVSICLILISFFILRFTIIFTMQEEFKEIGIMKAIGIKNEGINRLYLSKYIAMSVIGAFLGFLISVPFQQMLLDNSSGNIILKDSSSNLYIKVFCSIFIIFVVIVFCYLSTRKINRFSAIDAIRNGSTGVRFRKKNVLKLYGLGKMPPVLYMALNDIISNLKRYMALIFTFSLGILLIIIPLNAGNTLKDDHIVTLFGVTRSDIYFDRGNQSLFANIGDKASMSKEIFELEDLYKQNGIEVKMHMEVGFTFMIYTTEDDKYPVYTSQGINSNTENYTYLKGVAPVLNNEVALTEIMADKVGVSIGDRIYATLGNKDYEFIITAIYQSMNQMGECMRISGGLDVDYSNMNGIFMYQGDFVNREDIDGQIKAMKKVTPDFTFLKANEYIGHTLGEITNQIDTTMNFIIGIVICINCLITILMMQMFASKERTEIAMLKSIGFKNKSIKIWQVLRILIILSGSLILGISISYPFTVLTMGPIFNYMGASSIQFTILWRDVLIKYPLIIFSITTMVAIFSIGNVEKVKMLEINNAE